MRFYWQLANSFLSVFPAAPENLPDDAEGVALLIADVQLHRRICWVSAFQDDFSGQHVDTLQIDSLLKAHSEDAAQTYLCFALVNQYHIVVHDLRLHAVAFNAHGVVGCASIDDYRNNVIKKHENTRADKEEDRIRHVDTCSMQTGPIFLAYRAKEDLKEKIGELKKQAPVYDFVSEDGIGHRVWVIDNDSDVAMIEEAFGKIPAIYIADGHHRCASAVKVGLKRREQYPDYTGEEEFNYFLSVIFPDEELRILDYNRVVKDLNGMDAATFLTRIEEYFAVEKKGQSPYRPTEKGTFGMYLENEWYSLSAKEEIKSEDAVEGLDVSLLQNNLLDPILGIMDPKTDKRIDFVGGIRGLGELERRVHTDMKVAFSMYPTSIAELFAVADAGRLMPPKSTWFEPKLRSGLFLHEIER